jgi:surfactin synthase thioesterase subunit
MRRLGGLPEDPEALRALLPVLKADTRLYRNYVYRDESPLDIPIFAYGGGDDPNVRPENLERWRDLTTAAFVRREFAGGHFYLRSNPGFLAALRADLQAGFTADS